MEPFPSHMVFSGGGFSAIVFLGIVRFLEIEGLLHHVRHVSGTSAGALTAVFIALGITTTDLEEMVKDAMLHHPCEFSIQDMLSFFHKYGFDDGHQFTHMVEKHLQNKTFLELLKQSGKNLVICATNVATMEATYFSAETTPHVLVKDALRASMAIPWIVQPVKIGEDYYIDGFLTDNVPIEPFSHADPADVFVSVIDTPAIEGQTNPMSSPVAYTLALTSRYMIRGARVQHMNKKYPHVCVFKRTPISTFPMYMIKNAKGASSIRISITEEQIDESIALGYREIWSLWATGKS